MFSLTRSWIGHDEVTEVELWLVDKDAHLLQVLLEFVGLRDRLLVDLLVYDLLWNAVHDVDLQLDRFTALLGIVHFG